MPIKLNHFAIFDLETTSLDTNIAQPIEIAAQIYNCRSLEPIPGAVFCEYCKPTEDCKIDPKVWDITKIDPKTIENAPSIRIIFPKFVEFIRTYNAENNKWTAPIACGQNIDNYDIPIIKRMLKLFCKKKEATVLFNEIRTIDLMDISFLWFEDTKEVEGWGLPVLRKFMGIANEGQHRAMKDVIDSGMIITRFLKFHRELSKTYLEQMRDCFKPKTEVLNEI